MAGVLPPWEQALPLLAVVKNHGDLAVKLSSLKQVKDILLKLEPSLAADILPYLVELHSSPENLVRKYLIEVIDEIGTNRLEHLSILFPALLLLLKDGNPAVAKQSIVNGIRFFNRVLEELSFQFQRRGMVERWLEDLWMRMIKFRDTVLGIIHEAGAVGPKLLALKFLETCILQFSLDLSESERSISEGTPRHEKTFNISLIIDGHPLLDPRILASDANRYVGLLLEMLRPPTRFPGSLTISAVNSLAAISRKRPIYYKSVLTALLEFDQTIETVMGRHTASIRYSLRTAFLGFLRCTHSAIAESRERLVTVLRASNAGDAADQVIRQTDKIMRNIERERASRDLRLSKDAQVPKQLSISGDMTRKRLAPLEKEDQNHSFDVTAKKSRHGPDDKATASADINDVGQDRVNGVLTPVEQMITMIGALLAEGERGLDSLELLVSNIHPDLLADIVITNMKHLPKNILPLGGHSNLSSDRPCDDSRGPAQAVLSNGFTTSTQPSNFASQVPLSSSNTVTSPVPDISVSSNLTADSKRDPRRDPRRLDPRRAVVPVDVPPSFVEENSKPVPNYAIPSDLDAYGSCHPVSALLVPSSSGSFSVPVSPKTETDLSLSELPVAPYTDELIPKNEIQDIEAEEFASASEREANDASRFSPSPDVKIHDIVSCEPMDVAMLDEAYSPSSQETDQPSLDTSNVDAFEIMSSELPIPPLYIELDEVHQRNVRKQALERVVNLYQDLPQTTFKQTPMALVARLFGQTNVDDVVGMVRRHIVSDYEQQKGHEFVMQILYHLQSLIISDSVPSAAAVYDKFLLGVAKSLLDDLPASDKSFSRLLSDIPMIPDSVLRLLEDICTESNSGGGGHDGDRVTQGLGAVWSLILGRPHNRQTCLDIALKCAVHSKDDVRVKSIRLVANKLYAVSYISKNIEQFATDMYLSSIHQQSDTLASQSLESENRMGGQVELQETSISGSQISEAGSSVTDSSVTFSQAQSLTSLYFALCTKKPSLLQLVFDNFVHAPKSVKQAVHRHIPNLVRALGSSCRELLDTISNPPQGSEPLLTQVLHELSEGTPPSPDFIATVKTLYATRHKDATILIPIISAFSREEVLPIFPQLVRLPLDKFQTALAHILQGSALSGPALSPVEVLVAIHDVSPERDGVPLKKITDACSACFEQRTVFTESVLSKALNQMVDRTPLPLLFMRTVIQAIDAFPTLVDFVMEVLSKLVQRQIWRMPKLWVGFLKCISQTQPHSFRVLLQLPTPQLESALTKYPNLRAPLTAFANQPSVKTSISRSTLLLLGIAYEEHNNYNNQHPTSSFNASDGVSSSVRGATFT